MNSTIKLLFILGLVTAVFIAGCSLPGQSPPPSAPSDGKKTPDGVAPSPTPTPAPSGKIKREPIDVEGRLGEKLSNGHLELTVNSFEYASTLDKNERITPPDGSKFLILNIKIKNLDTQAVDWFNSVSIINKKTDKYGFNCKSDAVDYVPNAIDINKLAAGEERTGRIVCAIPLESDTIILYLNDKISYNIKNKYTADSDYGVIKVNIAEYGNKELAARGNVGEFVGNEFTVLDIKVNSFKYADSLPGLNVPERCYYPKGSAGSKHDCGLLILDVTVKSKSTYENPQTFSLQRFAVLLGKDPADIQDPEMGRYDGEKDSAIFFSDDVSVPPKYYADGYSKTIDLKKIKPGETRTGEIVYIIPKTDTLLKDGTNQEFYRYFPFERGEIRIPLKSG